MGGPDQGQRREEEPGSISITILSPCPRKCRGISAHVSANIGAFVQNELLAISPLSPDDSPLVSPDGHQAVLFAVVTSAGAGRHCGATQAICGTCVCRWHF